MPWRWQTAPGVSAVIGRGRASFNNRSRVANPAAAPRSAGAGELGGRRWGRALERDKDSQIELTGGILVG